MKRTLLFLMCAIVSTVMFSQVLTYRTVRFYTSQNTAYGWTNWSNPEHSNMNVQIDLNNDVVYIHSPRPQIYYIVSISYNGYDNEGNYIREFRFIDNDKDQGTMRLVARSGGNCQIYIIFANVRWCYDVVGA